MDEDAQDRMFFALANTLRRQILDIVRRMPGCSVNDVTKYFPISRIAVLKHIDLLEVAGLLVSRKPGRVRELYLNAIPIQQMIDRWTTEYAEFWASRAMDLKFALEQAETTSSPWPPPNAPSAK